MDSTKYYVLKEKAVPEVLLKVVGISRSSFYKYKDDIFTFHENSKGQNVTMMIQLDDTPGIMADLLNKMAEHGANILTIHQSIPINRIATLTLSLEILSETGSIAELMQEIEKNEGVHYLKIVGRG